MLSQKQILVIEDNPLNREMLCAILADQYAVLEAENGQKALDILEQCGDDIALILLDVMMPVMDGFTFLDQIKADAKLSLIPVIVMTQSDSEDDEVTALAHGATDFVPKPYRPQIILHRVASIIHLRETAAMVNQFKYDRLTGLYSREFFYQKVREQLRDHPEREYTIVCSNIENFKLYNDAFGAPAGDRLLQEVAAFFRERSSADEFCGHYEADRFLCLKQRSRKLPERIHVASKAWKAHACCSHSPFLKWGIYEITDPSVPVEQMCDRALLAVDSIKGQYGRRFAIYDDALRGKLLREQAITEAMETALSEGQFAVYLQPKYSLHDDGLAGAEALVRWSHPEWGIMSPGEFIPLFEKNGFITRMDQYVWEQVCILLRDWRKKGYPLLPVSVNVSRADIYQADLVDTLTRLIRKYDLPPAQLHLEITESACTENPAQIISTAEQLQKLGFIIEMDDFGSGYSSLNMLSQMKLDVLKLDMNFVQGETSKPVEQGILRFIVGLAHWMDLSVVAEGVETREQLERLREVGCDYVQGYFFAKPIPIPAFEELLKTQLSEHIAPAPKAQRRSLSSLLVVDENAEYRKTVRQAFAEQYQVLEAADASSALAYLDAYGHDIIHAVILSMTLPGQGAASILKTLRKNPQSWRIPVLATMPQDQGLEELALELDADDFLRKPHTQRGLRKRTAHLLGLTAYQERTRVLQNEACWDYLTGLLNRRGFHAATDALQQEDLPLAVYLFDLDGLKAVNDIHGYEAGDRVLRSFGEMLRHYTRDGDILCRYGGDEFVVIIRRISSLEAILRKGRDICRGLSQFRLPDGSLVSCTGGIALCGANENPSSKLIAQANQALHRAKQGNRGGCCLWDEQEKMITV